MTDTRIVPIVMPKWGLSMKEGKVTGWLLEDGTKINVGDAVLEVETDKIAGSVEASDAGVLRRRVGQPDTIYPVKTLLGVIADPSVPDSEIDAFVSAYVTPVAEEGEDDEGPKYEYAETPAGNLRYAKRGDGAETLILIHGFGGDLDNWLFNIDALGEKATVYALDLPGHGQSTKKLDNPGLKSLTGALMGFMDKLGIEKAHLAGHSMGGACLLMVAHRHPDLFSHLVIYEPVVFPPVTMDDGPPELAQGARRRRTTFASYEAAIANFTAKPPLNRFTPAALEAYVRHGFRQEADGEVHLKCSPELEATTFEMSRSHHAWDLLPEIEVPVLVMCGLPEPESPALPRPRRRSSRTGQSLMR